MKFADIVATTAVTAGSLYLLAKHGKSLGKFITEVAKASSRPRKPIVVKTKHYRSVFDEVFDTPEVRTTVYY